MDKTGKTKQQNESWTCRRQMETRDRETVLFLAPSDLSITPRLPSTVFLNGLFSFVVEPEWVWSPHCTSLVECGSHSRETMLTTDFFIQSITVGFICLFRGSKTSKQEITSVTSENKQLCCEGVFLFLSFTEVLTMQVSPVVQMQGEKLYTVIKTTNVSRWCKINDYVNVSLQFLYANGARKCFCLNNFFWSRHPWWPVAGQHHRIGCWTKLLCVWHQRSYVFL